MTNIAHDLFHKYFTFLRKNIVIYVFYDIFYSMPNIFINKENKLCIHAV